MKQLNLFPHKMSYNNHLSMATESKSRSALYSHDNSSDISNEIGKKKVYHGTQPESTMKVQNQNKLRFGFIFKLKDRSFCEKDPYGLEKQENPFDNFYSSFYPSTDSLKGCIRNSGYSIPTNEKQPKKPTLGEKLRRKTSKVSSAIFKRKRVSIVV